MPACSKPTNTITFRADYQNALVTRQELPRVMSRWSPAMACFLNTRYGIWLELPAEPGIWCLNESACDDLLRHPQLVSSMLRQWCDSPNAFPQVMIIPRPPRPFVRCSCRKTYRWPATQHCSWARRILALLKKVKPGKCFP